MVLNFHFAMGVLLRYNYLWNGYGPPVPGQSDGAGDWRRPPAVQHHVSTRPLMRTG